MDDEEWRAIPSLPEYEASSLGRLRRVPWIAPMPNGGERTYGGTPTVGAWSEEDQRFVLVYRRKTYRVARLICEAFNGPPLPDQVCMHIDENSRNNRPDNLLWGYQKENLNAPGFVAYCHSRTGNNSPFAKSRNKIHQRK